MPSCLSGAEFLQKELFKTSRHALESVHRLFPEPIHDTSCAVTVGNVVAERRKTVRLAALLHFGQLFEVELLIFNRAPIIFRVVHGEARCKGSIGADDQPVLAGTAAPVFAGTAHETFHVLEPGNGIDHLPALALLVDQPVEEVINDWEVLLANVTVLLLPFLKLTLLH